jgi:invasion protein IalB
MSEVRFGPGFGLVLCLSITEPATIIAAEPVEEVFQDWRVRCTAFEKEQSCQMLQAVSAIADGPQVFLLSLSSGQLPDQSAQTFGVITVPTGVYLAPGIEIHVDKRRPFKVLYEVCDQAGCHAGFRLQGPVLSAFRQGLTAKFRVWTGKSRAVEFPVSLRGFSAALQQYESKVQK